LEINRNRNDAVALKMRGEAFVNIGQPRQIKPKNAMALRLRGKVYQQLDDALHDPGASSSIEPDNAIALKK